MTLTMAPATDDAFTALASRWSQKARQLTTLCSSSALAEAFQEQYRKAQSSNPEEQEFLAQIDALHHDATSNETSIDSTFTRMQNLYKTSLLMHHGKYDKLLDALSLVVMPPKAATSVAKKGLSANEKKELKEEKAFAQAVFRMK